jgi:hypothetical protein
LCLTGEQQTNLLFTTGWLVIVNASRRSRNMCPARACICSANVCTCAADAPFQMPGNVLWTRRSDSNRRVLTQTVLQAVAFDRTWLLRGWFEKVGTDGKTRTFNLWFWRPALCQLSYTGTKNCGRWLCMAMRVIGGEGWIRTSVSLWETDLQSAAFSRSATSPETTALRRQMRCKTGASHTIRTCDPRLRKTVLCPG